MGVGSGRPWIFKHGTNIVHRGLKLLFFGLFLLFFGLFCYFLAFFCYFLAFFPLAPLEDANSAIFWYFLLIFGLFFRCPPGKFSADALGRELNFYY